MQDCPTFDQFVQTATDGRASPYPYQLRLAEEGLPDLLRAPTGAGKTLAAVLPWLYRRRTHPDPAVRQAMPRRLVVVLPQRSLVEQTVDVVRDWLDHLCLEPTIGVHVLMGGASTDDRTWKMRPEEEAIMVGTQDMILSRLLLRGYAEARAAWPVAFGLLHSSSQFVFDEVQLMGPALPTSLQLDGLRATLGTAAPCASMWMSATVDPASLVTADYPGPRTVVELDEVDRTGALRVRLDATRRVEQGDVPADAKSYARAVAALVLDQHEPGTRSIVMANTVDRATAIYDQLLAARPAADVVLLHSRFRPDDRARHVRTALATPGPAGRLVVATQVLEAGVDVSARLLVSEVAPWSSIVQRAGRCNRGGEYDDASLVWVAPPAGRGSTAPYTDADLDETTHELTRLDGVAVTSSDLQNAAVGEERPEHPVLRRRDLLDLFDTAPDLSGNDLDVSRWIRDSEVTTVAVAWRDLGTAGRPTEGNPFPGQIELCSAPIDDVRNQVTKGRRRAWIFDQTAGEWRQAIRTDIHPGAAFLLDAARGGYQVDRGWSPTSASAVQPVAFTTTERPDGFSSDYLTENPHWVSLLDHLNAVGQQVKALLEEMDPLDGLTAPQRTAAVLAGRYHDIGKAHPVFAESLRKAAIDRCPQPEVGGPWAKSPTRRPLRHARAYFRHELAGALLALDPESGLLTGVAERELVAYLVAAHHGKARLTVRPMPSERGEGRLLGIADGDQLTAFSLPDGRRIDPLPLSLDRFHVGALSAGGSWQAMTCALRDSGAIGPFRLGFLEAVVRVADWRASADHEARETCQ